ncbi:glutathione S-transferase alpha-4-like isoform X1 [Emys orbicularis]|uniref:glutathione S-transferase alpha-4-like isoform X1 n=3 Tax=Testudinoidea TaxID=8486 RepID=UPI0031FBFF0F
MGKVKEKHVTPLCGREHHKQCLWNVRALHSLFLVGPRFPSQALAVLQRRCGLDTCSGGGHTLSGSRWQDPSSQRCPRPVRVTIPPSLACRASWLRRLPVLGPLPRVPLLSPAAHRTQLRTAPAPAPAPAPLCLSTAAAAALPSAPWAASLASLALVAAALLPGQEIQIMATKPKLYYFNGRGRMETIRWLLATAGVEFEEAEYLETRKQYEKLLQDGSLLFQQVPMVEIDGMKMVQTRAILNYIAGKHNLYGKDLKERALIDMYVEGTMDLNEMIMLYPFSSPEEKEKNFALMIQRATNRYFPVYEKVLKDHGQDFLVGNQLSRADVQVLESILMIEEYEPTALSEFPLLQAFKARISNLPTIKKFLQPGSQRRTEPDDRIVETVNKVLQL